MRALEGAIRSALAAGWEPESRGRAFRFEVAESLWRRSWPGRSPSWAAAARVLYWLRAPWRDPVSGPIPAEWLAEFEAAARRPLQTRFRYAFIHTYKPVLDDAPFRSFETMADYRRWCEENLPDWLGYGRV